MDGNASAHSTADSGTPRASIDADTTSGTVSPMYNNRCGRGARARGKVGENIVGHRCPHNPTQITSSVVQAPVSRGSEPVGVGSSICSDPDAGRVQHGQSQWTQGQAPAQEVLSRRASRGEHLAESTREHTGADDSPRAPSIALPSPPLDRTQFLECLTSGCFKDRRGGRLSKDTFRGIPSGGRLLSSRLRGVQTQTHGRWDTSPHTSGPISNGTGDMHLLHSLLAGQVSNGLPWPVPSTIPRLCKRLVRARGGRTQENPR